MIPFLAMLDAEKVRLIIVVLSEILFAGPKLRANDTPAINATKIMPTATHANLAKAFFGLFN
jgi:hypothetical protein